MEILFKVVEKEGNYTYEKTFKDYKEFRKYTDKLRMRDADFDVYIGEEIKEEGDK